MIKCVLSISGNKAMNYLMQTVLSRAYRSITTDDVFQGMYLLKHNQDIDLLIIDIDYQTKESLDCILHINTSKLYKKPIIVLSNGQNQKANDTVLESNVYDHFIKPFNPVELLKSINELLVPVS